MRKEEIIHLVESHISKIFSLENIHIYLVGSVAINIKLNRNFENYFNGISDIDCVVILKNDNCSSLKKIIPIVQYELFNNNQIHLLNYSIKYGRGRNSINIKIIKNHDLWRFTKVERLVYRSVRSSSLTNFKKSTVFYGEVGEYPYEYNERKISDDCYLIDYDFFSYKNGEYILNDIHSMLLFSLYISKFSYEPLKVCFFKNNVLKIIESNSRDEPYQLFRYFEHLFSNAELMECISKYDFYIVNNINALGFNQVISVLKNARSSTPVFLVTNNDKEFLFYSKFISFYFLDEIIYGKEWMYILENSKKCIDCSVEENMSSVLTNILISEILNSSSVLSGDVEQELLNRNAELFCSDKDIIIKGMKLTDIYVALLRLSDQNICNIFEFIFGFLCVIDGLETKSKIVIKIIEFIYGPLEKKEACLIKNKYQLVTNINYRINNELKIYPYNKSEDLFTALWNTQEFTSKNKLRELFKYNAVKNILNYPYKGNEKSYIKEIIIIGKRRFFKFE